VATLHVNDAAGTGTKVMGVPMDARLPKVRFATRDRRALAAQRIVLKIDAWPADSRWPQGHFVKALGAAGDVDVETASILHELVPCSPLE
jgi:exoribonuclease R